MKGQTFPYRTILFICILLIVTGSACFKDKGNYDYVQLPPTISIDTNSYFPSYQKVFDRDTLVIDPIISYAGDANDLSYEWQIRGKGKIMFETIQKGKQLKYKLGKDLIVDRAAPYDLRLAVVNSKLALDSITKRANMVYSRVISLAVVSELFLGMMVLHGDGTQSDVGLIEDNVFMLKPGPSITTKITPHFYSSMNNGEKIPGVGKQLEKIGFYIQNCTNCFAYVYIFTDQAQLQTDHQKIQKLDTYAAMFSIPSYASGKMERLIKLGVGTSPDKGMVDNGRLFYGDFIGPLFNPDFNYYAAPYVGLAANYSANRGAIIFDTISKAFLFSPADRYTGDIYQFPNSTVSGVNLQPNDMKARMIYMETREKNYNTLAVLNDLATGNNYLAEFNFAATDPDKVAIGRYPMEGLPEYNDIRYYAFGKELNMVYYATEKTMYQYRYKDGNMASLVYTLPANEKITMMKIVKADGGSPTSEYSGYYQFSNKQLLVGTVDANGKGKLYVFSINTVTGEITYKSTFEGFGKIYDASVKDQ